MTDKLTLEEVELCCKYGGEAGKLARQLLDTLRENERLKDALGDLHALYAETDRTLDPEEVCGEAQELLYGDTSKDPSHE